MRNPQILLVGFGNMGQALARGWLEGGRAAAEIAVIDPADAARAAAARLGLRSAERIAALGATAPAVVVLAVKPNQLADALAACRAAAFGSPVYLSIAAGQTLARIAAGLPPGASIVRAMPNTPAAIGRGVTALVAGAGVTSAERTLCETLLAAVGTVVRLDDEGLMDAVTAVSGSGPAYVFLLIECLERAALDVGLPPGVAAELALGTVAGAAAYAAAAHEPAAALRQRVTSPGGTTQAALGVLMGERGLAELLTRAVRAAAERSRALAAE